MNGNVVLIIRQFTEAWRIMSTATGRLLASDDGVEYIVSGLPIPFFLSGNPYRRGQAFVAASCPQRDKRPATGLRRPEFPGCWS